MCSTSLKFGFFEGGHNEAAALSSLALAFGGSFVVAYGRRSPQSIHAQAKQIRNSSRFRALLLPEYPNKEAQERSFVLNWRL